MSATALRYVPRPDPDPSWRDRIAALGHRHRRYGARMNEHWFTSLAHGQAVLETWRREYNEERPKKGLAGLTPAAYAR